jgi:hypothetical protein
MPWNANDASRRQAAQRAQEQQQRFRRGNQQRVAKQMNDLITQWRLRRSARQQQQQQQQRLSQQPDAAGLQDGEEAGLGPLTPEPPIGEPQGAPSMREGTPGPPVASPGPPPPSPLPGEPGEIRGTVLNVVQPVVNVNPWLTMDIRTESGETVAVRKFFFWGAVTAPYIAEGHYVRVAGRKTRGGYIKPRYIVNETTGSRWN